MINLSTGLRNMMLNATGFKGAFLNGTLHLYSGSQPVSADAAIQGTLLNHVTLASGVFAFGAGANGINFDNPVAGVISKAVAEVWSGLGLAPGTIGWFRLMGNAVDALGASTVLARMDGNVGVGGADLNLGSTDVTVGAPLTIDVFQFTLPQS